MIPLSDQPLSCLRRAAWYNCGSLGPIKLWAGTLKILRSALLAVALLLVMGWVTPPSEEPQGDSPTPAVEPGVGASEEVAASEETLASADQPEATPTPEPAAEASPEPAPEASPEPTSTPTPSPSPAVPAPTVSPAPVPRTESLASLVAPAGGGRPGDGVPILMYHYVRVNPDPRDTLGYGLSVTPADFEAQMAFLEARGYRSVPVGDLASEAARATPGRVVAITFDDGYVDAYLAAYPSLRRHGFQATFYLIAGFVGRAGYLTWEQARTLTEGGMDVGSHTVSHPDLTHLSAVWLRRELEESRAELERRLDRPVLDFCYPSGRYDSAVKLAVGRAGYRTAVTVRYGYASARDDPLALPRVRVRGGMSLGEFAAALGEPLAGASVRQILPTYPGPAGATPALPAGTPTPRASGSATPGTLYASPTATSGSAAVTPTPSPPRLSRADGRSGAV